MAWSVTVQTLPGDFFPARTVGSVYRIGGTGSTTGSVISTWLVGCILDTTHNYVVVFTFLGLLMPLAYLFGTFLMGKVRTIKLPDGNLERRLQLSPGQIAPDKRLRRGG